MRLSRSLKGVGDSLRARFGSAAEIKQRIAEWIEDGGAEAFQKLMDLWQTVGDPQKTAAAEGLLTFDDLALWDNVWERWGTSMDTRLGKLLTDRGIEAQRDDLRDRSMLKLNRESEMPTDVDFAGQVMAFRDDPDLDVRRAATRYWHRLETVNAEAYAYCCLILGTYAKIGHSRARMDQVLALRKRDELTDCIEGYRRSLPLNESIYWDLRLGLAGKIRLDETSRESLTAYAVDDDESLRSLARDGLERLKNDSTLHYLWAILKLGETPKATIANVKAVARLAHDTTVGHAAMDWITSLEDRQRENHCLYETWIDDDDRQSLAWLVESGRRPKKPSDLVLAALLVGVPLDDHDGEPLARLLADAWARASTDQRATLGEAVEDRCDSGLVDAYEKAFGARRDFDLGRFVRALMAIDADERLFRLLPRLSFEQGSGLVRRWADTGWLPTDPVDRAFVQSLVERFQSLSGDSEPAWAEAPAWFKRYARAMNANDLTTDTRGIVWVNIAAGSIPELLDAPLSGDPDEFDDYLAVKKRLEGHDKPLPMRVASLLDLLILFRRHYATTVEVFEVTLS